MEKQDGCPVPQQTMPVPECPICWDNFNDSLHMPRLLRCGHTICQICLDHLLFDAGLGQRCVRCPECRSLCISRGIHELPKNYILLRLLAPSTFANRETGFSVNFASNLWQEVSWIYVPNFLTSWLPKFVGRTVSDIVKLVWAVTLMVILLPLSFAHLVLAWWTALLGAIIFVCVSAGGLGIAVSMFFVWSVMGIGRMLRLTFHSLLDWQPCLRLLLLGRRQERAR